VNHGALRNSAIALIQKPKKIGLHGRIEVLILAFSRLVMIPIQKKLALVVAPFLVCILIGSIILAVRAKKDSEAKPGSGLVVIQIGAIKKGKSVFIVRDESGIVTTRYVGVIVSVEKVLQCAQSIRDADRTLSKSPPFDLGILYRVQEFNNMEMALSPVPKNNKTLNLEPCFLGDKFRYATSMVPVKP
jgi:hypothetical protein